MDQSKETLLVLRDTILVLVIVMCFLALVDLFSKTLSRAPIENPNPIYIGKENILERGLKKPMTGCFFEIFRGERL